MNPFFVLPTRSASHRFEVDPLRMFPTHPPLARRLERLEELARKLGRGRSIPSTPDPVFVESPTARPDNPQALGAFFLAVFAWGILGGAFLSEPDVTNGALVWIPPLGSLAFFGGIILGLQGVGRTSAGARRMGYAVTGLLLLLGPWALALMAMVVFGILALLGAGPVPG